MTEPSVPGADQPARRRLHAAASGLLHLLLPPRCPLCRSTVAAPGYFCPACWSETVFLGPLCCRRCGEPFEVAVLAGAECGRCLTAPPAFDWGRAGAIYAGPVRRAVLMLKQSRRFEAARPLARAMAARLADLPEDLPGGVRPYLHPIPLHGRRLLRRRFNQALALAEALQQQIAPADRPDIAYDWLIRRRATAPQTGQSRKARARNMASAFAVPNPERVAGRDILLIDDVYTTGATVTAAAHTLKKAGAGWVGFLTAARTPLTAVVRRSGGDT